ncbi:hypothetical protein SAMN05216223_101752 [Actinacidiphila yanglinensis]|uniref:Nucleopolyhedrovirus P10 family protein n=1 Tax=Actinacidiphila yanglinensis TaxID=310779 RepID=A0A1H5U2T9_9ACTN|nr:hypothetical protein [Actinacidiphila yanglinensis]SEF69353.1 hypothetical protein SAMN05216223_101752 [Actinacidiphila yanglinensis]
MDRLARTVREQVALGRLLPLGGPEDTAWITERAAVAALRAVCAALPGVRLGEVDVAALPDDAGVPEVPAAAPLGALPHQPLRIEARFEAAVDEPLPVAAERLRFALFAAAGDDGLGLPVHVVDLAVTGLLDGPVTPSAAVGGGSARKELEGTEGDDEAEAGQAIVQGTAEAAEAAAKAVPGVVRLTRRLAGHGGLRIRDTRPPVPPARHVQVQIATARSFRPLAVARETGAAVTTATTPGAPGPVTTAVIVTDIA